MWVPVYDVCDLEEKWRFLYSSNSKESKIHFIHKNSPHGEVEKITNGDFSKHITMNRYICYKNYLGKSCLMLYILNYEKHKSNINDN